MIKKWLFGGLIFFVIACVTTTIGLWIATAVNPLDLWIKGASLAFTIISVIFGTINGLLAPIKTFMTFNAIKIQFEEYKKKNPPKPKKVKER